MDAHKIIVITIAIYDLSLRLVRKWGGVISINKKVPFEESRKLPNPDGLNFSTVVFIVGVLFALNFTFSFILVLLYTTMIAFVLNTQSAFHLYSEGILYDFTNYDVNHVFLKRALTFPWLQELGLLNNFTSVFDWSSPFMGLRKTDKVMFDMLAVVSFVVIGVVVVVNVSTILATQIKK